MSTVKRLFPFIVLLNVVVVGAVAEPARAITLKEAISVALDSNPEIGQAIENREAIEFELRQARGLYLPRVDLDASAGPRLLDSPGRRALSIDDNTLSTREVGATVTWKLFDGFGRDAEVERQASRVDGASLRVLERSEYVALAVSKEYLELLLQSRIVAIAQENLAFHQGILGKISQGVSGGTLTQADRKQAQERLKAAEARIVEARDALAQAKSRFFKLVALPASVLKDYPSLAKSLPSSVDAALGDARRNNPQIRFAEADIDASYALVKGARSKYMPEVSLEGRARTGEDIEGVEHRTSDLQARVVAKWNVFNGGIDKANEQEQIRRVSEARLKLHQIQREVDEATRTAWDKRAKQVELERTLREQARAGASVVDLYQEQFRAGRRTLLDVLSAQNTYINTLVLSEIAHFAHVFATYRVLGAMGSFVNAMGLTHPAAADGYARAQARVPETPPAETMRRYSPDRERLGLWATETVSHREAWRAEPSK